jgi:hypothetical protein
MKTISSVFLLLSFLFVLVWTSPVLATWEPNGNSICTAGSAQQDPRIVPDEEGGAIVVWEDKRSGDWDVYVQRIDASGAIHVGWPAGGVLASLSSSSKRNPEVITDGAHGAIVVWENGSGLSAQRIDASGVRQWTDMGASICTYGSSHDVVSVHGGGAVITWRRSTQSIFAQRIESDGSIHSSWPTDGQEVAWTFGQGEDHVSYPQITRSLYGWIIIWVWEYPLGSYQILALQIDFWGNDEWPTWKFISNVTDSELYSPQISSADLDNIIITWSEERPGSKRDIYAQRISSWGVTSWGPGGMAICTENEFRDRPRIWEFPDFTLGTIITWEDYRSDMTPPFDSADIYAQRIDNDGSINASWLANGGPNGVAVCTAIGDQDTPEIIRLSWANDIAILTWRDYRDEATTGADIYARRIDYSTGQVQWLDNGQAICAANFDQSLPVIASRGAGGAIITWIDGRNPTTSGLDIYAQQIDADGNIGLPCEVRPTAIDFGTIFVGGAKVDSFTIKNTIGGLLTGSVSESCPHYRIVSMDPPDDPYSLAYGDSLVVTVSFEPLAGGMHPCTIETGDAACSDISCIGETPTCEVTPGSLDFDTVFVGGAKVDSFTIANTGGGTLAGSVSESCAHYSVISGNGPYSLAAGESVVVTVSFEPTASGAHPCTVETGAALCSDVSCTGVGQGPICDVTPASLNFGTVSVGSSTDMTFTMKNAGGGTLTGSVSESCPHYSIISTVPPDDPYNLARNEELLVTVQYGPGSVGTHPCTIETGDGLCADLDCTGEGSIPVCDISSTKLDFGGVEVGDSLDKTFTITNDGVGALIGSITESCNHFSIESGGGPFEILPGETDTVKVRFLSTVVGSYQCTIETGIYLCSDVSLTGLSYIYPPDTVLYVDADAVGAGDGSSWMDALTEVRDALIIFPLCPTVTDIWVAEGTYTPTNGTDRKAHFTLRINQALYGGFAGNETMRSERDWAANESILSGDIGILGENTDNSYNVVFIYGGTDATGILDGFAVTGGFANGISYRNDGGGVNNWVGGSPTLANLTITGNYGENGGGMYNEGGSPTITNVVFTGNSSGTGGGMYNYGSSPVVVNAIFRGNSAGSGGGLANAGGSPTLTNVTITGNSASASGGGMHNLMVLSNDLVLTNIISWGNSAAWSDPEIYNGSSTPLISYSLIAGCGGSGAGWDPLFGNDGGNNIDTDPLFVDAVAGNYRLGVGSPAINAGYNFAPSLPETDLDGNSRIVDGTVDMGPFENQWAGVLPTCEVTPSSIDFGGIAVGTTKDTTFVIKNIGGGMLDVSVNERCWYYYVVSGSGPFSLAPGESLVVGIRFEPTANGLHECLIETNPSEWNPLALVADHSGGLQLIDVGDPVAPALLGTYNTLGWAYGVDVLGDHAFVADYSQGLQVIDISNPTAPTWVGSYNTSGNAYGVEVSGDHAYVADYTYGLQVINISNPASPSFAGSYFTPTYAYGVDVSGNHAFVADRDSGLQVVDITDPTDPKLAGTCDTPGQAYDVHVYGGYAFVADYDGGLQVINITDPTNPTLAGTYDTPHLSMGIDVSSGFAFIADSDSGLQVIDIINPTNPTLAGSYNSPGPAPAWNVDVLGDYAFVAERFAGLRVIDISNPLNPTLVGTYDTPGNAMDVIAIPFSTVACTGYAGYAYAVIDSIVDVPADQGSWVRVCFSRSFYDHPVETQYPIDRYDIHRRIDNAVFVASILGEGKSIMGNPVVTLLSGEKVQLGTRSIEVGGRYVRYKDRYFLVTDNTTASAPPGVWEVVGNVSAQQQDHYIRLAPTLGDSLETFFYISAHTTTPAVFFDSPVYSGFSVDNIAPGVPEGFMVAYNTGSGNQLSWDPCADPDFQYFKIYRDTDPNFVPGAGSEVGATANITWTDPEFDGWTVYYKITAIDYAGNESDATGPGTTTAVTEPVIPEAFTLHQNVPNPFNPTTRIRYDVPAGGGKVTLKIYNVQGRLVRTLVNSHQSPGQKIATWHGRNNNRQSVASGVYFYRMVAPGYVKTRKLVLLK